MADEYENFDVIRSDGIVRLAIESTSPMNSLNDRMTEELFDLATSLGADPEARCIVLRGSDGVFCAGGNVSEFDESERAGPGIRRGASLLHDVVVQLKEGETPVITGIDGPAVGAGFSLALLGDLVLMKEDAYLQYGYPGVGLTGDGSSTFYLPRIVGLQEAKRIALLNDQISAEEAEDIGLVTESVPTDEFDERLETVARQVAEGPTVALGRIVKLFERSFARQLPDQLAAETDVMARTTETADYREGVQAFKDKREPEFSGR